MLWLIVGVVATSLLVILLVLFLADYMVRRDYVQKDGGSLRENGEEHQLPVDLVITWVNLGDPEWGQRYEKTYDKLMSVCPELMFRHDPPSADDSTSKSLQFAVRLALKNMPWLRSVIILTQRPQRPSWLGDDDKVRVVHHDEVMSLETFSGMVTTAHTVDIPGLSEHFIQMDDDIFVVKPVSLSYFFDEEMRPVLRPGPQLLWVKKKNAYSYIQANTCRLVRERLRARFMGHTINHSPVACKRSLFCAARASIPQEHWDRLKPIRCKSDFDFFGIYLPSYLVREARKLIRIGKSTNVEFREGALVKATDKVKPDTYFICLNNDFTEECDAFLEKIV